MSTLSSCKRIAWYFGVCVCVMLGFCSFWHWDNYSIPISDVLIQYLNPCWKVNVGSAVFYDFIIYYLRPFSPKGRQAGLLLRHHCYTGSLASTASWPVGHFPPSTVRSFAINAYRLLINATIHTCSSTEVSCCTAFLPATKFGE